MLRKTIYVLLAGILLGQWGCAFTEKPIRIGYLACLTGANSHIGVSGEYGALLAEREINESGGINGRPLELISEDDMDREDVALKSLQDLMDMGVTAIVGPMMSSIGSAIVPHMNEKGILVVSPTVSTDLLTQKDDYFFRLMPTTRDQGYFIADAVSKRNIQAIAIIYEYKNRSFSENLKDYFTEKYRQSGGRVVFTQHFSSGETVDYTHINKKIANSGAEAVFLISSSTDAAGFCQQFALHNIKLPVFLSSWSNTNDLLKQGGPTVEGVYTVSLIDYDSDSPRFKKFQEMYWKKYGEEPNFSSIASYESVIVLAETLKGTTDYDADSLKNSLLTGTFKGLQDDFKFNPYGDIERPMYLYRVQHGKYVKTE